MSTRRELLALASGAAVAGAVTPAAPAIAGGRPDRTGDWVATWAAAPTTIPPTPPAVLSDQTVRQVVHTSLGGDELRIRLSNEFGDPLRLRPAYDSGDGLHPNDTGMAAMAAAVPLRLFR